MNVDFIFKTLNKHGTDFILIGGLNFLFNHSGPITFDCDLFVEDTAANLDKLNAALQELECEWGATEATWKRISGNADWLKIQPVFCLSGPHGAIDIFRSVVGLEDGFEKAKNRSTVKDIPSGEKYLSLSDFDMLRCQMALDNKVRKRERVRKLKEIIFKKNGSNHGS